MEIRIIDAAHKQDINIPNEPFALFGRMIPSYINEQWNYDVVHFGKDEICEMIFPDENYDYDIMLENSVFVGAYDGEKCVALAILQDSWNKYMYLYDLKVSKSYRCKGIASALIDKAKEICKEKNYHGLYTQGQDNNLAACEFYIKAGFHIGGFDSNVYKGTRQEGKSDIIFYMDC
ncbi:MAG: GNAT family N-acetyltransferase [Clostridiales bacterium]|nr:GNAT family N-acetyltransferase [Clostridiales bacterium]